MLTCKVEFQKHICTYTDSTGLCSVSFSSLLINTTAQIKWGEGKPQLFLVLVSGTAGCPIALPKGKGISRPCRAVCLLQPIRTWRFHGKHALAVHLPKHLLAAVSQRPPLQSYSIRVITFTKTKVYQVLVKLSRHSCFYQRSLV